jgi:hypothetical protein
MNGFDFEKEKSDALAYADFALPYWALARRVMSL